MQVILQEDIANLGSAGDIVKVKEGYGRNFLVPRKLAVLANEKNVKMLDHQKRVVSSKLAKKKGHAEEVAQKLSDMSVTIQCEVGEEDKLFGSVTNMDIANALRKEGVELDRHNILLKEPIKKIGVFDVDIKLHPEVTGQLKVWVVKGE